MRIGYPCINRTITCQANKTFRLKSYSEERFIDTVENNLDCLKKILEFNLQHQILFFRISSDIIPFASHPVQTVEWVNHFKDHFNEIGSFIKKHRMRISMHPDQFIVLNTKRDDVLQRSIQELEYHAMFLDALKLNHTAKIQLHVGGVYGDKQQSMNRFIDQFDLLSKNVKQRLVIENDDRSYMVKDCLFISNHINIPVLLDVFHHQLHNNGESVRDVLEQTKETWKDADGLPMVDYSSQQENQKRGKHAQHINRDDFIKFLEDSKDFDVDVMLEIKDKEVSAIEAIEIAQDDFRFFK